MKTKKFMGRTLTTDDCGESWRCYKSFPLISLGTCVDGTYFGSLHFSRHGGDLQVRARPSWRSVTSALSRKARQLRAELETLK